MSFTKINNFDIDSKRFGVQKDVCREILNGVTIYGGEIKAGFYQDEDLTEFAKIPSDASAKVGEDATWENLKLAYPRAFSNNGKTIKGSGFDSYFKEINASAVIIPNTVTLLDRSSFARCSNLKSIRIPNSVTRIGLFSFMSCSNLTDISIPHSVEEILTSAFAGCPNLVNITFNHANKDDIDIYSEAFELSTMTPTTITHYGCLAIESYSWQSDGRNVTFVERIPGAYTDETFTTFAKIPPDASAKAGEDATWENLKLSYPYRFTDNGKVFKGIDGMKNYSYIFSPEVIKIGYECFREGYTRSIILTDSVEIISQKAFYNCPSLQNIQFGNSVSWIGKYAFEYNDNLVNLTIPKTITTIEIWSMANNDGIENIIIPNGIKKIKESAFANCDKLTNITIPKSVKKIKRSAFNKDSLLTEITFKHTQNDTLELPTAGQSSGAFYVKDSTETIVKHYGCPNVLNYDWSADNRVVTFVDLRS